MTTFPSSAKCRERGSNSLAYGRMSSVGGEGMICSFRVPAREPDEVSDACLSTHNVPSAVVWQQTTLVPTMAASEEVEAK